MIGRLGLASFVAVPLTHARINVLDHANRGLPARTAWLSTHWSARRDMHRSRYRVNFGSIMTIGDTLFHPEARTA